MSATCEPQLCRDYCALGHFPETPMCVAYQTSTCGPCAAMPTAEGCTLDPNTLPGAGRGGAGGGGAGTSSSTGGSGGATGGSAGTAQPPNAGGGGTAAPPKGGDDDDTDGGGGDSGCSVGSAGSAGAGGKSGALTAPLLLLGLAVVLRRRARVRT
jgi:MYXO-CTERM domain-containing protein